MTFETTLGREAKSERLQREDVDELRASGKGRSQASLSSLEDGMATRHLHGYVVVTAVWKAFWFPSLPC